MPRQSSPLSPAYYLLRRVFCFLSIIVICSLPKSSSADLFYKVEKVIKLKDLNPAATGAIPFSVTGLSNAGRMTGYFPGANANKLHAFVWDNASQQYTDINDQLLADSSMATCINDAGTVAGVFWELGTYAEKGFLYYADGTVSTFAPPAGAGGNIIAVTAINTNGDLIGSYADVNGLTRGYIVQQGATAGVISDLGDLGLADCTQYTWPNALNEAGQVVGNAYLISQVIVGATYTKGFFWDRGMTLIDASDLSNNWTAVSLDSYGEVVGLYGLGRNPTPFSKAGSYFWDGQMDTDLGDLGGNAGANVFALTDDGFTVGTSQSVDGALHLFSENPNGAVAGGMVDLGGVSLYESDTSFSPLSLRSTVIRNKYTGNKIVYSIAGFGVDASGSTRSLLWKDSAIHSVIELMPAYLSVTAISHDYGSMVLINNSEQIVCAGTDASGQQMALLLSVDPDTDNDGLPDSWEMQYYGQLGVGKNDLEAGGGGLTNWQAFQQGTNPNDFFNGQAPQVTIVSGDSQIALPNNFVAYPLIVQVSNSGGIPAQGAAVTFAVASGGGQLQVSNQASPKLSVLVQCDTNGQAKIFFQASSTPGAASIVIATASTSGGTCSTSFSEKAYDANNPSSPSPPTPPSSNPTPTDPNNPATPEPVPVQSYACIDLSGTSTNGAPVTMVALDDNQASFAYMSPGVDPAPGTPNGSSQITVAHWVNGSTTFSTTALPYTHLPTPSKNSPNNASSESDEAGALTPGGRLTITHRTEWCFLYGSDDEGWQWIPEDNYSVNSTGGSVPSDFQSCLAGPVYSSAINDDGNAIGSVGFEFVPGCSFIDFGGRYIYFGQYADGVFQYEDQFFSSDIFPPPDDIVYEDFSPTKVNSNGWAVGGNKIWDGGGLTTLGTGAEAADINKQNQAVVRPVGGNGFEGYLWENGSAVISVHHLPAEIAGKISNIQPYSISNQTAPGDPGASGTDATIYILATANVTQSDGTVVNGATIVCTRDNDGEWSFSQIGLPSNVNPVNFTAINSSGELAFTWYDNDDSNQTPSVSTQAVRPAQTSAGTPQPAQTPNGKLKAGVAPRLVLTFNTNKPEATDDQAWPVACADFKYNYHVGVAAADSLGGVDTESWPYEYIYKIKPDNSGATTFQNAPSDMAIYEDNFFRLYLYRNGQFLTSNPTADKPPGHIDPNTYNPACHFSYTNPAAPRNPIMYAFDAPNALKNSVYKFMKTNVVNRYEYALTLLAYPMFKNPNKTVKHDPVKEKLGTPIRHTFTIICTSDNPDGSGHLPNGTGNYHWSISDKLHINQK